MIRIDINALNPAQKEAVAHNEGPLLVLAGAGSGKTKVVTTRIARLILEGHHPRSLLAVTFTNKAAKEMRERVFNLVGKDRARGIVISTFHSLCARMLRRDGHRIDLSLDFAIIDTSDQLSQLRRVAKENGMVLDEKMPRMVLGKIGYFKNQGYRVGEVPPQYDDVARLAQRLYEPYTRHLRALSAVDFDDLLLLTRDLLSEVRDVRERYRALYQYLMVDEYQDTNPLQLDLVKLLTNKHNNLCVVGDDDQAIYSFRGATVENILVFDKDFDNCRMVILEENYRSTAPILALANAVIEKTPGRRPKTMFTSAKGGTLPELVRCEDSREEATFIADEIATALATGERTPEDFALLYRANPQSRSYEEELRLHDIPYRVVGGQEFFERREVKDIMSYMNLIARPSDEIAFRRAVNLPPRGLGEKSVKRILETAAKQGKTYIEFGLDPRGAALKDAQKEALENFCRPLHEARLALEEKSVRDDIAPLVEASIAIAGIEKLIARQGELKDRERYKDAFEEVVTSLSSFCDRVRDARENPDLAESGLLEHVGKPLSGFLDQLALDDKKDREKDDRKKDKDKRGKVTLMTFHASKGLEYPCVFMVGFEDGFLPHRRAVSEGGLEAISEERRLCYVGITRAKERLYMTYAAARRKRHESIPRIPSRFLDDIPETLFEKRGPVRELTEVEAENAATGFFENMRTRFDNE